MGASVNARRPALSARDHAIRPLPKPSRPPSPRLTPGGPARPSDGTAQSIPEFAGASCTPDRAITGVAHSGVGLDASCVRVHTSWSRNGHRWHAGRDRAGDGVRRCRRPEARPLADLSDLRPANLSDFRPAVTSEERGHGKPVLGRQVAPLSELASSGVPERSGSLIRSGDGRRCSPTPVLSTPTGCISGG
jgi:hypothetical protein